jgi:hypothetical protein
MSLVLLISLFTLAQSSYIKIKYFNDKFACSGSPVKVSIRTLGACSYNYNNGGYIENFVSINVTTLKTQYFPYSGSGMGVSCDTLSAPPHYKYYHLNSCSAAAADGSTVSYSDAMPISEVSGLTAK